jgi:hypothetical protein
MPSHLLTRTASWTVPAALLAYAGCRWLDGRDGSHGPGFWWDLGHVAFLNSWLAFAALAVAMALRPSRLRPGVARALAVATVAGTAAFGWVTLTDLFQTWPELPDPLRAIGPLLFLAGLATLLGATAQAQHQRNWLLYPALALAAVVCVSATLALLPLTAVLFVPALAPTRTTSSSATSAREPILGR